MYRKCPGKRTGPGRCALLWIQLTVNEKIQKKILVSDLSLSIEWNSIRLSGPARGIVTKTVHKTMSGDGQGVGGGGDQRVEGGGVRGVGGGGNQVGRGGEGSIG